MAQRVTLTKQQMETDAGLALLDVIGSVTADGRLSDAEVRQLKWFLDEQDTESVPALAFLKDLVGRILADGVVTDSERTELMEGIERVLPASLREGARARRWKAEEADEEADGTDFMVAGTDYEGRQEVISRYQVDVGTPVFLRRDPGNRHSRSAIQVLLKNGACIGYVPEKRFEEPCAAELAPLLDEGYLHLAEVTKLFGHRAVRPLVEVVLFEPGSQRPGAVAPGDVPSPNGEGFVREQPAPRRAAPAAGQAPTRPAELQSPAFDSATADEPVSPPSSSAAPWVVGVLSVAAAIGVWLAMR